MVVPIAVALGLPVLWDHGMAIMLASIWLAMNSHWGLPREVTAPGSPQPAMTASHDPATA